MGRRDTAQSRARSFLVRCIRAADRSSDRFVAQSDVKPIAMSGAVASPEARGS